MTPPATVTFAPRPGQTLHIPYAMTTAGEVYARIYLRRDGEAIGLSSVRMSLISDDGPPISATTEFDGSIVFSAIPPGTYTLELDQDQARRLGMRLKEPKTITVEADDMLDIEAEIILAQEQT